MELFKSDEYVKMANPSPGKLYREEVLGTGQQAKDLGGIFVVLPPGSQVAYHYHKNRESIMVVLSGYGIEVIEGKEIPITAGDVLYIPAEEKHTTINRSDKDLRWLEYFTYPPVTADFVEVR
jgi:quercetin dioxygenase-like cupin family protein